MKALVLLNMGASRNKEEFKVFLKNMFNDKYILTIKNKYLRRLVAFFIVRKILKNSWEHFEKIGGMSPMYNLTERLVSKLQEMLPEYYVCYTMRYTSPFSFEIIKNLQEKNIKDITLLSLYPHNSTTTKVSSEQDFLKHKTKDLDIKILNYFFENPLYNKAIVENIKKSLVGKNYNNYNLIFSAHSLPQKVIDSGDSYKDHIEKNVEILKEKCADENMDFASIALAYQSKVGRAKWLEPSLSDVLKRYKGKNIIIYPISFIIDNSETIYELDIEYKELALELGVKDYIRVECLNDNDIFCEMIKNMLE
ncbi:MAG: ferrochelatase [Candidatus Gracilibacteria bacterium]|nr:ferrochelatase [Candidatus Gracilibacteria bacterium]